MKFLNALVNEYSSLFSELLYTYREPEFRVKFSARVKGEIRLSRGRRSFLN